MSQNETIPPELGRAVEKRLQKLDEDNVVRRIWDKDFTVWRDDPTEITDRLGWLIVHEAMRDRLPELREFAKGCVAEGFTAAVLAGMGGSSLAPEVLRRTFGVGSGMLDLIVLDTTHPDQILGVERSMDLARTLFIISSKSGTTTETLSHFAYFWDKVSNGSQFVAITDPGTSLEKLANERGFRQTFLNPPDIGGRYSALSYVGLVPAAVIGADLEGLLDSAAEMAERCRTTAAAGNPGARLGVVMGEAQSAGRDKITLVLSNQNATFGYWVEQLLAESTGKDGTGLVPVEGEDLGRPAVYGADRVFVGIGDGDIEERLRPLGDAGHPTVTLPFEDPDDLGAAFFQWEFATAVAGLILGIHPFDQPNVQEAKDATEEVLSAGKEDDPEFGDLDALLGEVRPGDYISIQAYLARTPDTESELHAARMRLRDRLKVATTVGFGPRFLHSTGQLHKGGPNSGVFIQVVQAPREDIAIPGKPYSFGKLLAAQATGDLKSLKAHDRRVVRIRRSDLKNA